MRKGGLKNPPQQTSDDLALFAYLFRIKMPPQKTLNQFFKPLSSGGVKRPFSELSNDNNKSETSSSPSAHEDRATTRASPDGKSEV